jgi:hypothetical protein
LNSKEEVSVPRKLTNVVAGGVGAALDFAAPANLAVPGLIEGARAMIPKALGGISGEQAATNITSGSIPGTEIPYAELAPSKLIENFTGKGSIQNKEYEQANVPLHKLTEAADKVGSFINEKFDSPLAGTAYNIATAGALLHGVNRAAQKATEVATRTPSEAKLNKAKEESDNIRTQEEATGQTYQKQTEGFVYNDRSGLYEKGSLYIDPMTRAIVDRRQGTQGPTTPRVDERFKSPEVVPEERRLGYQAGEPLVTFPDGTTMTRAEYEKHQAFKGNDVDTSGVSNPFFKGDKDANVEVDSVSGRPIFPEDVIQSKKIVDESTGKEIAGAFIPGLNGYYLNPEYIASLWGKLKDTTKEKLELKSAEDLQNFVELHERQHWSDHRETGRLLRDGETIADAERRINNLVKEQREPLTRDETPFPDRLPENFREPRDGPPRESSAGRSPAQMRANKEQLERTLASVNERIRDAEASLKEVDTGALHKKRKVLEELIENHERSIEFGKKHFGFDFKPKKSSESTKKSKDRGALEESPEALDSVFRTEYDKLYQEARNDGKSDSQAREQAIKEMQDIYGSDGIIDMNMGAPFTKKHLDMLKQLWSDRPSLKEFAEHIGRGIDDKVTKDLYEKYYGKEITSVTPEQAAISKIPGLKETVSPELIPLPTMIERWKTETDISDSPSARALRENLSSGGRMTAMRTGNSFIDWNVENILGETKRAQVVIKQIQNGIKGEVNKLTGPLISQIRGKTEGSKIFIEAMTALLKSEGKLELPEGIRPEAKALAEKLRASLDDLGLKIQEELRLQGIEGFQWRPNYLAGVFFGPYRSVVKDAQGNTIGVVAGRTKKEATSAIDYLKEQMPEVSFDLVQYNPKFDEGPGSLGARYGKASEVLELLRNQSESSRLLQENLSGYYSKVQENYMGYKQHFKEKKGVFGSEGARPWENARNNAFDLLEAQLGIIDHGYHWLAEQKLMRDMDTILTNPDIAMAESKRYVLQYLDHAFGRTQDKVAFFSEAMDFSAQLLGISPSSFKEMTSILRNTALTGTLGASLGFISTQLLQVPVALTTAFSKAHGEGINGNKAGSSMIGTMDLVNGILGKFENMTAEGKYYFQYFAKNGVLDPHLVEHTIHRKIVPTTGMSPIGRAIWGSVNGAFKGMEAVSGVLGKYTIERPEVWTRGTFAMTMAHFYRSAGYSMKEAAIRADKDTSTLFVDYSSQERAMMFQRMGEMGKLASTVSTFKINNLNQWFTFSNKKMYGALSALALTTWLTTGLNGMPGMDEAEFGATWLKSKGIDIPTPREFLLSKVPDPIAFGPLSSTPKWVGEAVGNPDVPAASLHRKFDQSNVIPDDLASFIYPLLSFYTQKISKGKDMISSGFAKNETGAFVREMVPGNFKFGADYALLTNDKGLTIDSNQLSNKNPAHYDRTKQEWKLAIGLGVVSQREWKNKQINQLDKISQQAWKESTKTKVQKTISAFNSGDSEKYNKLAQEAIKYNPDAAEEIASYIEQQAISMNIPLQKMLEIKFSKEATSPHGVNRFKQFKEMRENQ